MIGLLRNFIVVVRQSIIDFRYNYKHIMAHSKETDEINFSRLRMFCHMLDKGMNNIHFEKGHSQSVYNIAVKLRNQLGSLYKDDPAFLWADEIIGRFEMAQLDGHPALESRENVVYSKQQIDEYTCFITTRTSCRNFLKKEIPSSVLKEIVRIAIDAPNSCCRQVVRYYITQNEEKIKQTIPHVAGITNFSNIQCLVCVAAETSYYELTDKNLRFVDASLSAENFILGASLYGVYGTMCNFFHASEQEISICKDLFDVGDTESIIMFIAMGYPTNIPQKPTRRNLQLFYKVI